MKILEIIINLVTAPYNFIINSKLSRININPYLKTIIIFLIALACTIVFILCYYLPIIIKG